MHSGRSAFVPDESLALYHDVMLDGNQVPIVSVAVPCPLNMMSSKGPTAASAASSYVVTSVCDDDDIDDDDDDDASPMPPDPCKNTRAPKDYLERL